MKLLILPGLDNSGPTHWQSIWEGQFENAERVQQQSWSAPVRQDWVTQLDAAIAASPQDVVLVAHSLGCALVNWWASSCSGSEHFKKVKAALLVAPPGVERASFPAPSFAPMPIERLPFPSTVVASDDDPWCSLATAKRWAEAWGAQFYQVHASGHINADSNLGAWEQGQKWLAELITRAN